MSSAEGGLKRGVTDQFHWVIDIENQRKSAQKKGPGSRLIL